MKTKVIIGVAPTRRDAFLKESAHQVRDALNAALVGYDAEFISISGVNEEDLLLDDASAQAVIERFRSARVDGVFFPHVNFGTEFAVAQVAQALQVPVLLWGPQDDTPSSDGMRSRDTQCGLFATGKVLRRMNVPFDYIPNCRIEDPRFRFGLDAFIAVCRVIKAMRDLRILQIGPRPQPFWSVMCNEGELLERFHIQLSTVTLGELVALAKQIEAARPKELTDTLSGAVCDYSPCGGEEVKVRIAALKCAMQTLCQQRGCRAVAIQCWDELQAECGLMPCNSNALLTDEGIPVACELDIHGAISSVILQAAANAVPFFADMTIRHPEDPNAELLWHCGNFPTCSIADVRHATVTPNVLLAHHCPGTGHYRLKDGNLTICRFDGDHGEYRLFIGEGHTTTGPETTGTYVWLKVENMDLWEYKLVTGPYIHHCSGAYGHVAHILYASAKYMPGVQVELADKTPEEMLSYWLRGGK